MPHTSNNIFQQVSYQKYGSGPAIILLHGFPEDGNLWRFIHPALSASATVLVPDLPGSGESVFPGDDISIEQLAESVNLLMERESIEEAIIAGHSMGGYVALAFAEKYPQKVKGLSMVHSTSEADDDAKKETRRKAIELIRKGGKEAFIRQMVPNLFSITHKTAHAGIIKAQLEHTLKSAEATLINYYNAMINRPKRTELLKKASYPVQWIIGKEDNVVPFSKALQQSHLASINFVSLYNDSGHMSMLEDPGRLAGDMNDFITYCYNAG